MRKNILLIFAIGIIQILSAQDRVSFKAADSLEIIANLYEIDPDYPYIILLHQGNSSKGEYRDIAVSLLKLKYNCLAVDLRSGWLINFTPNETAQNARRTKKSTEMIDADKDILAAIDFVTKRSDKKIILFGSSYSASLALKIGKTNPLVKAIIAYSPGEYFKKKFVLHDVLQNIDKPIYVAGSQLEYPYLQKLTELVPKRNLVVFQPQNDIGDSGAKSLWKSKEVSKEYWLSLLMFINKLH